jgi:hypothetical protein
VLCQPIASSVTSSAKKVMEDHNREDRIVRTGLPRQDGQKGTSGQVKLENGSQDRTGRTGPAVRDHQEKIARNGQSG